MKDAEDRLDIEAMWEYGDPRLSEARFRLELDTAGGDDSLELQTQLARALGLQGRFADAHAALTRLKPSFQPQGRECEAGTCSNAAARSTQAVTEIKRGPSLPKPGMRHRLRIGRDWPSTPHT